LEGWRIKRVKRVKMFKRVRVTTFVTAGRLVCVYSDDPSEGLG
jgi:hypothetical protein